MADELIYTDYSPVSATKTMHAAPRFGHSKNFSVLFYDDKEEQVDYVLGLIFGACLILILFLTWAFLIVFFKCLRRTKRFGFLSGDPMVRKPGDPIKYGRPFYVRVSFLICLVIFISFSVTLVTKGITKLQDTVATLLRASDEISSMQQEVDQIVDSLDDLRLPIREMQARAIDLYENATFCPDNPSFAEDTGYDFDGLVSEFLVFLKEVGNFLETNVTVIEEASAQTAEGVETFTESTQNYELSDWQSLVILVPFIFIPTFLLVGLILAWFDASARWYTSIIEWILLPLLILITTVSIAIAAGVLIGAVANADFCEGNDALGRTTASSPDYSITDFIASTGLSRDDLIVKVLYFYVSQCSLDDPLDFLGDYKDVVTSAVEERTTLADAMTDVSYDRLSLECGMDYTPLDAILQNLRSNLDVILANAEAGIELLKCERVSKIYTNTVYSGTCTLSVTGVSWVFASSLLVGIFGMLLVMLRSAMWDVVEGEEKVLESYAMGVPPPYEEADERAGPVDSESERDGLEKSDESDGDGIEKTSSFQSPEASKDDLLVDASNGSFDA